ncbi:MAG: choice-of-anchor R domain-containing protein [Chloroflexota bacterium]
MNQLAVEILNSSGTWQDITADTLAIQADGLGLTAPRGVHSRVGRAKLTLNNLSQTYTPDVTGSGSALLDVVRRVRIKASGATLGKALQVNHSGLPNAAYFKNTLTQTISVGQTWLLTWEARAQYDSQYNVDVAGLFINTSGLHAATYTYTNKWQQYSYSHVISLNGASIEPRFYFNQKNAGLNAQVIEYRNVSLTLNGGANLLTNGNFASGALAPWTNVNVSTATAIATNYDPTNRDSKLELRGPFGGVSTVTIDNAGVGTAAIGYYTANAQRWKAQSFQVNVGQLSQCTVYFDANTGSPTGSIIWEIRPDNAGVPAAMVLQAGTFVPVPSSNNTITVSNGILLNQAVTYWLVLRPTYDQAASDNWNVRQNTAGVYSAGQLDFTNDYGITWFPLSAGSDLRATITTTLTTYDKLAQSFQVSSTSTISYAALTMARVGGAAGTMTLRIETDNAGSPSGTLVNANATATVAETSLAGTFAAITFTFAGTFTLSPGIAYWLVLSSSRAASNTDYVQWGTDISSPTYPYGGLSVQVAGLWTPAGMDAIFEVGEQGPSSDTLTVISDYWIVFNGLIEEIDPDPFARAGGWTTLVTCYDFTSILQNQTVDLPLQKDQRSDQLIATLLATLPSGTLDTTLPGKLLDSGSSTFQRAFDGYTNHEVTVLEAMNDAVLSEYGRQWFDLDGTLRASARGFIPQRIVNTPALSLTDGLPFDMSVLRAKDTVINKSILTAHPRQTAGALQALAQVTTPITLPPRTPTGPSQTTLTLTFRDSAGKTIGGDGVVTPLVPGTDFRVWERVDSSGNGAGFEYTNYGLAAATISNVVIAASQVTLTFNNAASGSLYVTGLQVRGYPVYTYDPVTVTQSDSGSIALYQERAYTRDLVFANDPNFAASLGQYYLSQYKAPFVEVQSVTVDNKASLAGVDLLGLRLMEVISITDAQTNLSAVKHLIVGVDYALDPTRTDYVKRVTLHLERLDNTTYWLLGDAIYGRLEITTVLHI